MSEFCIVLLIACATALMIARMVLHGLPALILAARGELDPSAAISSTDLDGCCCNASPCDHDDESYDADPVEDDPRCTMAPGAVYTDCDGAEYDVVRAEDVGDRPRWWIPSNTLPEDAGLRCADELHTDENGRPEPGDLALVPRANPSAAAEPIPPERPLRAGDVFTAPDGKAYDVVQPNDVGNRPRWWISADFRGFGVGVAGVSLHRYENSGFEPGDLALVERTA